MIIKCFLRPIRGWLGKRGFCKSRGKNSLLSLIGMKKVWGEFALLSQDIVPPEKIEKKVAI